MGLGRLVPRYRANRARGELPVLFLVLYALCAGATIATPAWAFGVGATLLRHVLYFPDAPLGTPLLTQPPVARARYECPRKIADD
jgi:hypothetical protein